jgi:hypothetical protein
MNHQSIVFFVALAVFMTALLSAGAYAWVSYRRRQTLIYGSWESILERFTKVDRESVERIALDFMSASPDPDADMPAQTALSTGDVELDPAQIWPLIGGMEGLEVLRRNCAVLVDMAFYVQQWYPEALAVAEQLRLNAREIEWHVDRLKGAAQTGKLASSFPDYAQRAVTTYYLMTRRVLTLFEQGDFPGLFDVQSAL